MPSLPFGSGFFQLHSKFLARVYVAAQFHSAPTESAQRFVTHLVEAVAKLI